MMMPVTSSELTLPLYSEPFFIGRMPLPPGVNSSYCPGDEKQRIRATRALNQFKKDASLMLADRKTTFRNDDVIAKIYESVKNPPYIHTPLFMHIKIYTRTLWYYDIDAFEKAAIDAVFLRLGMKEYDNLPVDKYTSKRIDRSDHRIEVTLSCVLSPIAQK